MAIVSLKVHANGKQTTDCGLNFLHLTQISDFLSKSIMWELISLSATSQSCNGHNNLSLSR